jgi:hypothetical protein
MLPKYFGKALLKISMLQLCYYEIIKNKYRINDQKSRVKFGGTIFFITFVNEYTKYHMQTMLGVYV